MSMYLEDSYIEALQKRVKILTKETESMRELLRVIGGPVSAGDEGYFKWLYTDVSIDPADWITSRDKLLGKKDEG